MQTRCHWLRYFLMVFSILLLHVVCFLLLPIFISHPTIMFQVDVSKVGFQSNSFLLFLHHTWFHSCSFTSPVFYTFDFLLLQDQCNHFHSTYCSFSDFTNSSDCSFNDLNAFLVCFIHSFIRLFFFSILLSVRCVYKLFRVSFRYCKLLNMLSFFLLLDCASSCEITKFYEAACFFLIKLT